MTETTTTTTTNVETTTTDIATAATLSSSPSKEEEHSSSPAASPMASPMASPAACLVSPASATSSPEDATLPEDVKLKQVDFYRNPTILSRLILNQKFTSARRRLQQHPQEAKIWVCTKRASNNSDKKKKKKKTPYSFRQLPLHMACAHLRFGSTMNTTEASSSDSKNNNNAVLYQDVLEGLLAHLIVVFPQAAGMRDHAGRLALHEALWYEGSVSASTISLLLMAAPNTLHEKDFHGRTPLELVWKRKEERETMSSQRSLSTVTRELLDEEKDHDNKKPPERSLSASSNNKSTAVVVELLERGVTFWEQARDEAFLRMKQQTTSKQPSKQMQRHQSSTSLISTNDDDDDEDEMDDSGSIRVMQWSQLEKRAIQLEQLLAELYEQNYEMRHVVANLSKDYHALQQSHEQLLLGGTTTKIVVPDGKAVTTIGLMPEKQRKQEETIQALEHENEVLRQQLQIMKDKYNDQDSPVHVSAAVAERRASATSTLSMQQLQKDNERLELQVKSLQSQLMKQAQETVVERVLQTRVDELTTSLHESQERAEMQRAVSLAENNRLWKENQVLLEKQQSSQRLLKSLQDSPTKNTSTSFGMAVMADQNEITPRQRTLSTGSSTIPATNLSENDKRGDVLTRLPIHSGTDSLEELYQQATTVYVEHDDKNDNAWSPDKKTDAAKSKRPSLSRTTWSPKNDNDADQDVLLTPVHTNRSIRNMQDIMGNDETMTVDRLLAEAERVHGRPLPQDYVDLVRFAWDRQHKRPKRSLSFMSTSTASFDYRDDNALNAASSAMEEAAQMVDELIQEMEQQYGQTLPDDLNFCLRRASSVASVNKEQEPTMSAHSSSMSQQPQQQSFSAEVNDLIDKAEQVSGKSFPTEFAHLLRTLSSKSQSSQSKSTLRTLSSTSKSKSQSTLDSLSLGAVFPDRDVGETMDTTSIPFRPSHSVSDILAPQHQQQAALSKKTMSTSSIPKELRKKPPPAAAEEQHSAASIPSVMKPAVTRKKSPPPPSQSMMSTSPSMSQAPMQAPMQVPLRSSMSQSMTELSTSQSLAITTTAPMPLRASSSWSASTTSASAAAGFVIEALIRETEEKYKKPLPDDVCRALRHGSSFMVFTNLPEKTLLHEEEFQSLIHFADGGETLFTPEIIRQLRSVALDLPDDDDDSVPKKAGAVAAMNNDDDDDTTENTEDQNYYFHTASNSRVAAAAGVAAIPYSRNNDDETEHADHDDDDDYPYFSQAGTTSTGDTAVASATTSISSYPQGEQQQQPRSSSYMHYHQEQQHEDSDDGVTSTAMEALLQETEALRGEEIPSDIASLLMRQASSASLWSGTSLSLADSTGGSFQKSDPSALQQELDKILAEAEQKYGTSFPYDLVDQLKQTSSTLEEKHVLVPHDGTANQALPSSESVAAAYMEDKNQATSDPRQTLQQEPPLLRKTSSSVLGESIGSLQSELDSIIAEAARRYGREFAPELVDQLRRVSVTQTSVDEEDNDDDNDSAAVLESLIRDAEKSYGQAIPQDVVQVLRQASATSMGLSTSSDQNQSSQSRSGRQQEPQKFLTSEASSRSLNSELDSLIAEAEQTYGASFRPELVEQLRQLSLNTSFTSLYSQGGQEQTPFAAADRPPIPLSQSHPRSSPQGQKHKVQQEVPLSTQLSASPPSPQKKTASSGMRPMLDRGAPLQESQRSVLSFKSLLATDSFMAETKKFYGAVIPDDVRQALESSAAGVRRHPSSTAGSLDMSTSPGASLEGSTAASGGVAGTVTSGSEMSTVFAAVDEDLVSLIAETERVLGRDLSPQLVQALEQASESVLAIAYSNKLQEEDSFISTETPTRSHSNSSGARQSISRVSSIETTDSAFSTGNTTMTSMQSQRNEFYVGPMVGEAVQPPPPEPPAFVSPSGSLSSGSVPSAPPTSVSSSESTPVVRNKSSRSIGGGYLPSMPPLNERTVFASEEDDTIGTDTKDAATQEDDGTTITTGSRLHEDDLASLIAETEATYGRKISDDLVEIIRQTSVASMDNNSSTRPEQVPFSRDAALAASQQDASLRSLQSELDSLVGEAEMRMGGKMPPDLVELLRTVSLTKTNSDMTDVCNAAVIAAGHDNQTMLGNRDDDNDDDDGSSLLPQMSLQPSAKMPPARHEPSSSSLGSSFQEELDSLIAETEAAYGKKIPDELVQVFRQSSFVSNTSDQVLSVATSRGQSLRSIESELDSLIEEAEAKMGQRLPSDLVELLRSTSSTWSDSRSSGLLERDNNKSTQQSYMDEDEEDEEGDDDVDDSSLIPLPPTKLGLTTGAKSPLQQPQQSRVSSVVSSTTNNDEMAAIIAETEAVYGRKIPEELVQLLCRTSFVSDSSSSDPGDAAARGVSQRSLESELDSLIDEAQTKMGHKLPSDLVELLRNVSMTWSNNSDTRLQKSTQTSFVSRDEGSPAPLPPRDAQLAATIIAETEAAYGKRIPSELAQVLHQTSFAETNQSKAMTQGVSLRSLESEMDSLIDEAQAKMGHKLPDDLVHLLRTVSLSTRAISVADSNNNIVDDTAAATSSRTRDHSEDDTGGTTRSSEGAEKATENSFAQATNHQPRAKDQNNVQNIGEHNGDSNGTDSSARDVQSANKMNVEESSDGIYPAAKPSNQESQPAENGDETETASWSSAPPPPPPQQPPQSPPQPSTPVAMSGASTPVRRNISIVSYASTDGQSSVGFESENGDDLEISERILEEAERLHGGELSPRLKKAWRKALDEGQDASPAMMQLRKGAGDALLGNVDRSGQEHQSATLPAHSDPSGTHAANSQPLLSDGSNRDLDSVLQEAERMYGQRLSSDVVNAWNNYDVLMKKTSEIYGKPIPSDVADALSRSASISTASGQDDLERIISDAEAMYGKELPADLKFALYDASSSMTPTSSRMPSHRSLSPSKMPSNREGPSSAANGMDSDLSDVFRETAREYSRRGLGAMRRDQSWKSLSAPPAVEGLASDNLNEILAVAAERDSDERPYPAFRPSPTKGSSELLTETEQLPAAPLTDLEEMFREAMSRYGRKL